MVDTRVMELKKEQEATQTMVGSLVDRLETLAGQMKEMQTDTNKKWEGMQTQLVSMERAMHTVIERSTGKELLVERGENFAPRHFTEQRPFGEDRRSSFPKLDFPDFDGSNLEDWVYRSGRYFELERTDEADKVRMASVYMYGKALQWHYTFIKNRGRAGLPLWTEYVEALNKRFGKTVFEDPMGKLKNLRQEGEYNNLYTYMEEFDLCLRKVLERMDLPEEYQISLFINGLKEEYRRTLWLLKPSCLLDAQTDARLLSNDKPPDQAGAIPSTGQSSVRFFSRAGGHLLYPRGGAGREGVMVRHTGTNPYDQRSYEGRGAPQPTMEKRRLTHEEINDRRNKGLCFGCNEPHFRDHKCSKRLYSMVLESAEEGVPEEGEANNYLEEEDTAPAVTLHAMNGETGNEASQTMRVTGQYKKRVLHILIDSGSTHNFLDADVAKRLGLVITNINPVMIMVADGRRIPSTKAVKAFTWKMQDSQFTADLYVIPLKGCELVLGIRWLAQLGDVVWNFQTLNMKFTWRGTPIVLQGMDDKERRELRILDGIKKLKGRPDSQLITLCWVKVVGREHEDQAERNGNKENYALMALLDEYNDIFQEPTALPPRRPYDHSINLKEGVRGICIRPYMHSATQKDAIEKMVEEMLESGIIQKSRSSFASPVILVKKKDNTWRMCVDYRQLNQQTLKEKFPIPLIEELLDELHGSTIFSKIDLHSGFHQIRMNPLDVHKTAFRTHEGHYEFLVMPFGLTNAPSTFQGLMNDIYRPYQRRFILVFFDDILIYSRNLEEHIEHLKLALEVLRKHTLLAKKSKCTFGCSRVEYLGHYIDKNGVSTDPRKIAAVTDWPIPKTAKQLRGFLGLSGYYRRFIRGYGVVSRPLTNLLKRNSFHWDTEAQEAMDELKLLLTTAPILTLPDFDKTFVVETDASDRGIGAVLMQDQHPLAYISKALAPKHFGLSVYEKELLSVVYAVGKWSHYLTGRHFVIRTDHKSLKFLLEQRLHNESQFRWLTKLMGYDYEIGYKQGKENSAADALSRVQATELLAITMMQYQPTLLDQIKRSWEEDPSLKSILQQAMDGQLGEGSYKWHQGLLRRKGKLLVGDNSDLRRRLLEIFHGSTVGGHSGVQATAKRLGKLFYWKGFEKDIRNYIKDCDVCQRCKYDNAALPGKLQPLPIPEGVWTDISMDFIEGLPKSHGKDVIMVVVDRLSKYSHFVGLSHPYSAATVAQAFTDNVYKLHGLPNTIVSDRDSVFLSNFWQEFFRLQSVELRLSSAYHPQTDGQTEVVNRCVETYLRCVSSDCPSDWFRWLAMAEWWYNTSYHTTIHTTPFQALYGYPPPIHVPYIAQDKVVASVNQHLLQREAAIQLLRFHMDRAQHRMKQLADKHRSDREFNIGDLVYVKLQPYRQTTVVPRINQKLSPIFFGPYRILDKIGMVAYKLELPGDSAVHPVFHVSRLRRSVQDLSRISRSLPVWATGRDRLPVAILQRKMVKRGHRAATKVLVLWSDSTEDDTTWEFLYDLSKKFSDCTLEDKCVKEREVMMHGNAGDGNADVGSNAQRIDDASWNPMG